MAVLPYDYYPAMLYIIDLISQGETETAACDKANIRIPLFRNYVNADVKLQEMLQEAMTRSHDAMADALVSIDNHRIHGRSDPKMAKVISDNIKWVLERRDSKRFGQKVQVTHDITMDRAIVDALSAAKNRVLIAAGGELLEDVAYTVEPSEEEMMAALLR